MLKQLHFPDANDLSDCIFSRGMLEFPDSLRLVINDCLSSSVDEILSAKKTLIDSYIKDYWNPPKVRYESAEIIDAYTIDYLPRNFFIPRIAIRDLALCREAVQFQSPIRVLDIGSGTGAVSLGIFELFSKEPLKRYNIEVLALDASALALERQRQIFKKANFLFEGDKHETKVLNLTNSTKIDNILKNYDSWDLIISANFMNELTSTQQKELVEILAQHLTNNGSIIISEPAQDRGKKVISRISSLSNKIGLKIFYPCCGYRTPCPKSMCWNWREYNIKSIRSLSKDGKTLEFRDKPLLISTLILNKNGCTIFDEFRWDKPELKWGVVAPIRNNDYEVCSTTFTDDKFYERGSLIGWQGDSTSSIQVREYYKL